MSETWTFLGATAVFLGGVYLYDQYQKNNSSTKKKIENTSPTQPPTVRTPVGGWNASEGYFQSGNFSYNYK